MSIFVFPQYEIYTSTAYTTDGQISNPSTSTTTTKHKGKAKIPTTTINKSPDTSFKTIMTMQPEKPKCCNPNEEIGWDQLKENLKLLLVGIIGNLK